MNAASHTPSGVFTWTSVSTTGRSAADAEPVATARPAATDSVTNSRRDTSLVASPAVFSAIFSSGIVHLLVNHDAQLYTSRISGRSALFLLGFAAGGRSHGADRSTQCRHAAARNLADSLRHRRHRADRSAAADHGRARAARRHLAAARSVARRPQRFLWEFLPPLRIGSWFSALPYPLPPGFSPPPCTLFTVAHARRSASRDGTPWSSYPSSMCSA